MLESIPTDSPIVGLAAELQRQVSTKRDWISDTRRVSLVAEEEGPDNVTPAPGLTAVIDLPDGSAEGFAVSRHAHQQIAEHVGVPWKFYDRLLVNHPDLLSGVANGLLSREPAKRMVRTIDGTVRAFLSDRYRPRDNWDLLEGAVLPALSGFPGRVEFKRCDLTETRMYVKIVLPDLARRVTPAVGDVIRGGVIIQNSEVGDGALGVFPYTDRLVCLNGMVHTDLGKRAVHVGRRIESEAEAWEMFSDETRRLDDAAFFAKCRDVVTGCLNETVFDRIVGQMRDLVDIKISTPPDATIEVLSARHGFTDGESSSMLMALLEGRDLSGWGYVNSVTQTARDLDDPSRQTELETIAGRLVADNEWAHALSAA